MTDVTYGSIHANAAATSAGNKEGRRVMMYRALVGLFFIGALLVQLGMTWTRPSSTISSSSRQDLYSRHETSFLAFMDESAADQVVSLSNAATSPEELFSRFGFPSTTSVTTQVVLTPQTYELSLVDAHQPSNVLSTLSLVPSRLDRCTKTLDIAAPVVHFTPKDWHGDTNTTFAGSIAITPLRSVAENCRTIALAQERSMAMLLFYSSTGDNDYEDSTICPSFERPLDLTPGYAAAAGAPRLSLAAAEARQGLTFPVSRISHTSGVEILQSLRSSQVLLRVTRRCDHRVLAQRRVAVMVKGTHDEEGADVVELSAPFESRGADPLSVVVPALRALLNTGWTPYRSIRVISTRWSGPELPADEQDGAFHVHLGQLPQQAPLDTQSLPLHAAFTQQMWHDMSSAKAPSLRLESASMPSAGSVGVVATTSKKADTKTARIDLYRQDEPGSTGLDTVRLWATLALHAVSKPLYRGVLATHLLSRLASCSSVHDVSMLAKIDTLVAAETQDRDLKDMSTTAVREWNAKWLAVDSLLAGHNDRASSCVDAATVHNVSALVNELVESLH